MSVLFLLIIGLVPFATAVLARNHGSVATCLYSLNMVAASLLLVAMWAYATRAGLLDLVTPEGDHWREIAPWLQIALIFGVSGAVALFDPRSAKLLWLLLVIPSFKPRSVNAVRKRD